MKKICAVIVSLTMVMTIGTPVFAHGHSGGHRQKHSVTSCTNGDHLHYYNGELHDIGNCTEYGHYHGN